MQLQAAFLPFVKLSMHEWEESKPYNLDDSQFKSSKYVTGDRISFIFGMCRAGNTLTETNRKRAGYENFFSIRFHCPLCDIPQWILKAVRAAILAIALGNTELAGPERLCHNIVTKISNALQKASHA